MPEAEPIDSWTTQPVIGSYRIIEPLGSGGMSSVYRAVHNATGVEVALKVLPPLLAKNSTVLVRFLREARSAESLQHPNIVSIFDRGLDRGRHYLVLEYVEGGDLHDYVQGRGPLAPAEAVEIIRQVAEGLRFAAGRGLIHRDIKPSNILRTKKGQIKIIDLGLALQAGHEDERVTREGTTVGTVDYMAPEQARDSRAISIQSDIYSLGCTLYYLLTGVPPFPGGDIMDKLTRHAKAAPPEVSELRPDVPDSLTLIMRRMMAKRPEDRFASYDDLQSALADAAAEARSSSTGEIVPLEPLTDERLEPARPPDLAPRWGQVENPRTPSSIPEISLRELAPALLADEEPRTDRLQDERKISVRMLSPGPGAVLLPPPEGAVVPAGGHAPGREMTARAWITLCVVVGVSAIILVIGLDQLLRTAPPGPSSGVAADRPVRQPDAIPATLQDRQDRAGGSKAVALATRSDRQPGPAPLASALASHMAWIEPEDVDPVPVVAPAGDRSNARAKVDAESVPAWDSSPIPDHLEGTTIVLRRIHETRDPGTTSSLRTALDIKADRSNGNVEIADEGPYRLDDLRVHGEARLVRSVPGRRSIVLVERPSLPLVRELPAVIPLDGKKLILDSIDLIVDVRSLPPNQTCLFRCTAGASLTLNNCTISILNPSNLPFAVIHAEAEADHPTRVRLERSLIRGAVSSVIDSGRGPVELAVRDSLFMAGLGPILRVDDATAGGETTLTTSGSILCSPGPLIQLDGRHAAPGRRSLVVRSTGSVLARFRGPGIASVLLATDSAGAPVDRIDWRGKGNVYCGWQGYFASGAGQTLVVPTLTALRSTWNGSDLESHEIPLAWPWPSSLPEATGDELRPFLPGLEHLLERVAHPRPFLFVKALGVFDKPSLPVVSIFPTASEKETAGRRRRFSPTQFSTDIDGEHERPIRATPVQARNDRPSPGADGSLDAVFDSDRIEWQGDLGAFLRDVLTPSVKTARVLVLGSGPKRCSPVRLPDGLVLAMRTETPTSLNPERLRWLPEVESSGRALIELRGGALALRQFDIQADDKSELESLIRVEEGSLAIQDCRLIAPTDAASRTRSLVSFQASTTRPLVAGSDPGILTPPEDRHVCCLQNCILISGGPVLDVGMGRGLVSLSDCRIGTTGDAVRLTFARVARRRFESDLLLDRCTMVTEQNIVRIRGWSGVGPGPDRPWLITSRGCAFLDFGPRKGKESVLLRCEDSDTLASGGVFWEGTGDAIDTLTFVATGEEPFPPKNRDVVSQWINVWGSSHVQGILGPRIRGNSAAVRLLGRTRAGSIQPEDLTLDPEYHPGRSQLDVGARLVPGRGAPAQPPAGINR